MDISPAHSAFYFTKSFFVTSHESKQETAKMIPHLAVSSFYLFLYHTLVDLFFFKTDSLHDIFQFFPAFQWCAPGKPASC